MDSAVPIAVTFDGWGATCDNQDDAGLSCTPGVSAPDVFYSLTPERDMQIVVDA